MLVESRYSLKVVTRRELSFFCLLFTLSLSLPIVFNMGQNGVSYRMDDPMAASVMESAPLISVEALDGVCGGSFDLRRGVRRVIRRLLCSFVPACVR